MRKTLMMFAALSLAACAGRPPIVSTPPAACNRLIPHEWADGVPAANVPQNFDTSKLVGTVLTQAIVAAIIAPWANAYVEMNGQLDKANGRTADTITIVQQCEAQVNAARPKGS